MKTSEEVAAKLAEIESNEAAAGFDEGYFTGFADALDWVQGK